MARKKTLGKMLLILLVVVSVNAEIDPDQEFKLLMRWEKPAVYPRPMLEGMNIDTLSRLLDAGNLQWFEPRPDQDKWEGVVGMKIHAPAEVVWEVITDYPLQCKLIPNTFLACETEYRRGNEVKNNYKCQTTVIRYAYKFDMIDIVKENPPYALQIDTIEGGLKGRRLDYLLVPVEGGTQTLFFMRYWPSMASLGWSMQAVLKVMPQVEPPTSVGAANYHSRAYKNEAERRVGYQAPERPAPLDISNLDLATLRLITRWNGGLIRETPAGKILEALTFNFIDAPPERVWEVITDFDHYEQTFVGSKCKVESRQGNEVVVTQVTPSFSILIFTFGYELHARYTLEPPYRLSYVAFEGKYQGTHGDLRLLPLEGGTKTLIVGTAGLNLDNDPGLTSRIAQSGEFPLENMIDMLLTQTTLSRANLDFGVPQALYVDWSPDGFLLTIFEAAGPVQIWGIEKPAP
jgi:carbon monoxide dehydrogenase subunit G